MTEANVEAVCSHEFNDKVFAEIKKHELAIEKLRAELKPLKLKENLSLAECNAIARKQALKQVKKR